MGTETGQRKCGHIECPKTEQGLEVRKRERHFLPEREANNLVERRRVTGTWGQ